MTVSVQLSDDDLIQNFLATKDISYFKDLVRRYQNRVYSIAFRTLGSAEEAEEVVQDTFLKVYKYLGRFRNQSSLSSWIFTITHNLCMDILRVKQRRNSLKFLSFDPQSIFQCEEFDSTVNRYLQISDSVLCPAQVMESLERQEVIAKSLSRLPANQRVVLVLHDIEGFSYQEISKIVGTNIGTIRSRLHYGRIKLKELLEPYFFIQSQPCLTR